MRGDNFHWENRCVNGVHFFLAKILHEIENHEQQIQRNLTHNLLLFIFHMTATTHDTALSLNYLIYSIFVRNNIVLKILDL